MIYKHTLAEFTIDNQKRLDMMSTSSIYISIMIWPTLIFEQVLNKKYVIHWMGHIRVPAAISI